MKPFVPVLTFAAWCLMLVSCEPDAGKLALPEAEEYVVVECYLTPGYPPELTLTQSNRLEEELVIRNLWYADVSVESGETSWQMENILYTKPDRHILVNYRAGDTLRADTQPSSYTLSAITRQQIHLAATTESVPPVRIIDYRITDNRIDVRYEVGNGKADYLKLSVVSFKNKKSTTFIRYTDVNKEQEENRAVFAWQQPQDTDSTVLTLFNIRKEYYDYGISVQNAVSAYHDPLLTPESIQSNINGGIGIFTYYTFDQIRITE